MRQEKEEWWNLVFEDCEYVGKTQRDYCLLRGISFEAFSQAKSRLRGTKRYIEPSMSLPICTVSLDLPSGKSINLDKRDWECVIANAATILPPSLPERRPYRAQ